MERRGVSSEDAVPYFCQWESPELVSDIIAGRMSAVDDPKWSLSGARDVEEYAHWANHLCGMACLKMVLAARTGRIWPTLELTRGATRHGAYQVDDGVIKGMSYAPFVKFVHESFGIAARVVTHITASDVATIMTEADFFMASVHHLIRWPERSPPRKGGHLVLVTAAFDDRIVFHNPSGHTFDTRTNAAVSPAIFEKFFAGRGVAILRAASPDRSWHSPSCHM
jgi:hypothetical protein